MSKNIIIQEGGTGKQMTVSKLKTDKVGGGSCLWVPEEEVSLGTKSISANGTYKASDDGKYGYSQVTVNVSGSQGSVNPDGTPNINPIDPNNPDSKVNPGGPGTSVVGTDPVTGNDYIIGVDDDGQLVTTPVPSVIEVTELPDKTDYTSGDPVDPSGLVAVLKNNDGSIFTNEDYPDGVIPISELNLPTTNVSVDETTGSKTAESELTTSIPQPIKFTSRNRYPMNENEDALLTAAANNSEIEKYVGPNSIRSIIIKRGDNDYNVWMISDVPYLMCALVNKNTGPTGIGATGTGISCTVNGKTVYFARITFGPTQIWNPGGVIADYVGGPDPDGATAWTVWYGSLSGGKQTLPVQWKSPYDGRTLETSYQVTVDGSAVVAPAFNS